MADPILFIGGNSGIGLATARLLADAGTPLLAAARSTDQLESLDIPTLPFDAESPDLDAEQLPERLAGLVYFPGTITLKPFARLTPEDFARDLQINLHGAIHAIQRALPALQAADEAAIVLFSTVAVDQGMPFHASIAAAKGAVEGFARSIAAELAPKIRVNLVAPTLTDTPLAGKLLGNDDKRESAAKRHPLQRVGEPDEVAGLVSFLLSPASRSLSGQVLRPDAGLSSLRMFS